MAIHIYIVHIDIADVLVFGIYSVLVSIINHHQHQQQLLRTSELQAAPRARPAGCAGCSAGMVLAVLADAASDVAEPGRFFWLRVPPGGES